MRCRHCGSDTRAERYCGLRCQLLHNVEQRGECWIWKLSTIGKGYGQLWWNGARWTAHRASYFCFNGDPGDQCVLHRCDTPACINPEHLFLGTLADNNADMREKGRDARGAKNGAAKLSRAQASAIRAATGSCKAVGKQFGVSAATVSLIRNGKRWAEHS